MTAALPGKQVTALEISEVERGRERQMGDYNKMRYDALEEN